MFSLGKLLVVAGIVLVAVGCVVLLAGRVGLPLGRLPGDIAYRGKNTSFYFPVVTCIVLSIVLSLVMYIINRFSR